MQSFKLLLLFTLLSFQTYSQSEYARDILNILCSKEMHGRGYVNKGDSLASEYLASEYEKLNLEKPGDTYFQSFEHNVNTFPTELSVIIDGIKLNPGSEFLIHPASAEGGLEHDVFMVNPKQLENKAKFLPKLLEQHNAFVVIDRREIEISKEQEKLIAELSAFVMFGEDHFLAGIIEIYPSSYKGLWSVSNQQTRRVGAKVFSNKTPKKFKKIKINAEAEFLEAYTSRNVIGKIKGKSSDSTIIVSAHYDHLGRMGPGTYFPGASDNASGTAMLLSLAKHFSLNQPEFDMMFICFAGEEAGIVGSKYYVENPIESLEKIKFVLNLDIMGTGDDGIQVVNGTVYKTEFAKLQGLNDEFSFLKQVKIRGERCNSDHCAFHEKGIPSFFSYTLGGKAEYHNIYDTAESLSLSEFDSVLDLFKQFLAKL